MTRRAQCGGEILVNMLREDLDDIPTYLLPRGYSARWYQPGDEELWVQVESQAEKALTINLKTFVKEFGSYPERLPERQCFLCDPQGTAIGTATAWFDDDYRGLPHGRLHWVAIVPEKQGLGLSKPLLTVVCRRLRDLDHQRGHLLTSTTRIPAINLYLKFGFVPEINTAADLQVWRDLQPDLREPLDLSRYGGVSHGTAA